MKIKSNFYRTIIIIITFLIGMYGENMLYKLFDIKLILSNPALDIAYFYIWWIIPVLVSIWLIYGVKNFFKELGLYKSIYKGLLWASVMVSPMFIGSFFTGKLVSNLSFLNILHGAILAGLLEEIFFRGFLFGQLFRKLKWGFIPAVALNAVIFAFGHIYQGNTMNESTGVFMVTFFGAAWFAWLYIEWNNNLWIPIFLHTLMNLSWMIFNVSENAIGGMSANIFRLSTIILSVIITIIYKKRNGGLSINRKNLFINRS